MALEITDETIDSVLKQNEITVIDFWAEWCGPCKMLGPLIDQLATEDTGALIGKLNVSDNGVSTSKYMITGIPCIVFFKNGNNYREPSVGPLNR